MQYWQRKLQRSVTEMRTSPMSRPWPSTSWARLMAVVVRLSAGLVEQLDALDHDARLDALDHVVDGQRADAAGHHRLHLDAGAGGDARLGDQRHGAGLGDRR